MRAVFQRSVLVLGGIGLAAVVARATAPGSGDLPFGCRLRGHGWQAPRRSGGAAMRRTCPACEHLDLPTP